MIPYTLPPLPYGLADLAPHIGRELLELHYHQHHGGYVKKANLAAAALREANATGHTKGAEALERDLAFQLSGHQLHSLYWPSLSADGGGRPEGRLQALIDRDFGSFDNLRERLTALANGVQGSGWATLVFEPLGQRLITAAIHDHQSDVVFGGVPLLVLDVWEHAYYIQYRNRRPDYVSQLWEILNWEEAEKRLAFAELKFGSTTEVKAMAARLSL